jgi:hypothetical protein
MVKGRENGATPGRQHFSHLQGTDMSLRSNRQGTWAEDERGTYDDTDPGTGVYQWVISSVLVLEGVPEKLLMAVIT